MTHAVSGTQGMIFSVVVEGTGSLIRRPGRLPLGDVRPAGLTDCGVGKQRLVSPLLSLAYVVWQARGWAEDIERVDNYELR